MSVWQSKSIKIKAILEFLFMHNLKEITNKFLIRNLINVSLEEWVPGPLGDVRPWWARSVSAQKLSCLVLVSVSAENADPMIVIIIISINPASIWTKTVIHQI